MIDWVLRALVAVAGSTAILLTVAIGRFDSGRDRIEAISRFVDQYRQSDRILQREIVNTRIGLSPSYDKMNAAMREADAAIDRLAGSVRGDASLIAATGHMRRRVGARADQIEQYKTDNALLQNALVRFSSLSRVSLKIPEVGMLSSAILHVAIENSPAAVADARRLLRENEPGGRLPPAVVTQVCLLTDLLPRVRQQLVTLRLIRPESDLAHIDLLIAQRTRELRDRQSSLYLALLASVLLAAFGTILLVVREVDRIRRLRRQSAGERLSGAVARLLLSADGHPLERHLVMALERIASHADAPQVFLSLSADGEDQNLSWPQRSAEEMTAFERLVAVARQSGDWRDNALICPWLTGPSGLDRLLLVRQGETVQAILGVMLTSGKKAVDPDVMTAVRLALAAVIQAAARDIVDTHRLELERQLAEAQRMKAIGVIASGVAHNFNNIVAAIGGFAEMALGRVRSGSAVAGHLEEITSAVARARALVDDILGYAGSKSPQMERVKLTDLLAETVRLIRVSYGDDADVTLDIAADPEVIGNPSRIQQVFMNICNNAEATAPGCARIDIGLRLERLVRPRQFCHARLPSGGYAVVTISDNGPGVPAAILPRMFEPFFTTRPSGTGLGLSTAWQIVASHGGTIDVASDAGGSHFSIWLPVAQATEDAQRFGQGERILILASDERANSYEDRVAALGYEPVLLQYSALESRFDETVKSVDAIVAVDPPQFAVPFLDRHARSDAAAIVIRVTSDRFDELPAILREWRIGMQQSLRA